MSTAAIHDFLNVRISIKIHAYNDATKTQCYQENEYSRTWH